MARHVLLKASVKTDHLKSSKKLEEYFEKLLSELHIEAIHGPTIVKRKGSFPGLSCVLLTHQKHIVAHTFPEEGFISISLYSASPVDANQVQDILMRVFDVKRKDVQIAEFGDRLFKGKECEAPKCVRPASREFEGRLVCSDCYDQMRDDISLEDFWL